MDYNKKAELIKGLASAIEVDNTIDTSNYVVSSQTLCCSALDLDIDALEKTKNVIEMQEKRLLKDRNADSHQFLSHLTIAKKCVEEIISQKKVKDLQEK